MAKAKKTASGTRGKSTRGSRQDAIAILKADHRQVEKWFGQFEKTRSGSRKDDLVRQICNALQVHLVFSPPPKALV